MLSLRFPAPIRKESMKIENHLGNRSGSKNRMSGKSHWEGAVVGCLILLSIFGVILAPFMGWSAAPGLKAGPFTTNSGVTYITVTITNGSSTNTYQIDHRADLNSNIPWIGSVTGILAQTNFSIPLGPELYMFYRAIDCDDCDGDKVPNYKDANPLNSNILTLTITIL